MSFRLTCLALMLFLGSLGASQLRLLSTFRPVYFHSDADPKILMQSIPFASAFASPETEIAAMSRPFIPEHDNSWAHPVDANLITVYGLKLTLLDIDGSPNYELVIDASEAVRPDSYPFTVAEVVEATKRCATLNFPKSNEIKLAIKVILSSETKHGEQVVAPNL